MAETCWRCGYFRCRCNTTSYEESRYKKELKSKSKDQLAELRAENKQLKELLERIRHYLVIGRDEGTDELIAEIDKF